MWQGNPIAFKDPTGHSAKDYIEGVKEEATYIIKDSVQSSAYTLLVGPAGLPVQSTIATIKALSNPKKTYEQATEKYRNLGSSDEHIRDKALGQVPLISLKKLSQLGQPKGLGYVDRKKLMHQN